MVEFTLSDIIIYKCFPLIRHASVTNPGFPHQLIYRDTNYPLFKISPLTNRYNCTAHLRLPWAIIQNYCRDCLVTVIAIS